MAATLNDYLVEVVYRSVYNTKKLVNALQIGVYDLQDVVNLLQIVTFYQQFLEFVLENDDVFTEDEIRDVMIHLDDILWTQSSTVVLSS